MSFVKPNKDDRKIRKQLIEESDIRDRIKYTVLYSLEYYFYNLKFPGWDKLSKHNKIPIQVVKEIIHELRNLVAHETIRTLITRPYDRRVVAMNIHNYYYSQNWMDNSKRRNPEFFAAFDVVKEYVENYGLTH